MRDSCSKKKILNMDINSTNISFFSFIIYLCHLAMSIGTTKRFFFITRSLAHFLRNLNDIMNFLYGCNLKTIITISFYDTTSKLYIQVCSMP